MTSPKRTSAGSTENRTPEGTAGSATRQDEHPPADGGEDPQDQTTEAAEDGRTRRAEKAEEAEPPRSEPPPTRSEAPGRPAPSERFAAVAERLYLGPLIAGIGLIIFGLLLLGGTQIAWRGLLDAVLAGLGLLLIIGSRRSGGRRGLLVVGVLLAILLLGVWRADVPLQGGLRFSTVTPTAPQDLPTTLRQTAGTLTIDLRRYRPPPGPPQQVPVVRASMGVGRLRVLVPPLTILQGGIVVGEGRTSVINTDRNGVGLEVPLANPNVPALARVDLRVGVGSVEVEYVKPS